MDSRIKLTETQVTMVMSVIRQKQEFVAKMDAAISEFVQMLAKDHGLGECTIEQDPAEPSVIYLVPREAQKGEGQ